MAFFFLLFLDLREGCCLIRSSWIRLNGYFSLFLCCVLNCTRTPSQIVYLHMILQLRLLEETLAGAFRRESVAEATVKQLEAEIEQLNRMVNFWWQETTFVIFLEGIINGLLVCVLRFMRERMIQGVLR